MSRRPLILPSLALALLLGASILSVNPAGGYPVSPQQQATVNGALDGSPQDLDDWQVRTDTTRLYLHSAPSQGEGEVSGQATNKWAGQPDGAALDTLRPVNVFERFVTPTPGIALSQNPTTQAHAEYLDDPDDRQLLLALPGYRDSDNLGILGEDDSVTMATSAEFPMAPVVDDVLLYHFRANVFAACDAPGTNPTAVVDTTLFAIQAHLVEQAQNATGAWVDDRQVFGTYLFARAAVPPGGITTYQAEGNLGGNSPTTGGGYRVEAGHRLVLRLRLPQQPDSSLNVPVPPNAACVVHYDSIGNPGWGGFPSHVELKDNSARVNILTTDEDGALRTAFPAGDSTTSGNRRVYARVVQASPWAASAAGLLQKDVRMRLLDLDSGTYVFNPETGVHVLEQVTASSSAISATQVMRTYEFAYDSSIVKARLQPEAYSKSSDLLGRGSEPWEAQGEEARIGGKGLALSLLPGEKATHLVNPRQPTQFSLVVANTGTQDDVATVSASELTGGWTARVLNGGQVFVAAGRTQVVAVEVTPPASAVAPATMQVIVRASSSFEDVQDPATIPLTVTLTNTVTRAVSLTSAVESLQVRPGVTKAFAVTLHNEGTSADSFVVLPSTPANVKGWSLQVDPTSVQVPAGGSVQVQVAVRAPAEGVGGDSFPLGLTAVEVGDSSVSDRVDVVVSIFPVEGVVAGLLDPLTNRTLRAEGDPGCTSTGQEGLVCAAMANTLDPNEELCNSPAGCVDGAPGATGLVRDADFDQTGLFRVEVKNLGDADDAFKVEGFWLTASDPGTGLTAPGTVDSRACDIRNPVPLVERAQADGIPDGWRFNGPATLGQPLPANDEDQQGQGWRDDFNEDSSSGRVPFSGTYVLNSTEKPFKVPARSTGFYLMELGFVTPACNSGDLPHQAPLAASPVAHFFVRVTSVLEPTRTATVLLKAGSSDAGTFAGPNRYAGGIHDNGLQLALGESGSKAGALAAPITYKMVAYNSGNEYDGLVLDLSDPPQGWTQALKVTGSVPPGVVQCNAPTNNGRTILCPRVGVFDEVHFEATTTPSAQVAVGNVNDMVVKVTSTDAGTISEKLSLRSRAAGTFGFEARERGEGTRTGAPGTTVPLPFVIRNLGTEADTFRASLLISDPAWSPLLSTGTGLFVPASHDGAGFLAVSVPANAPLGVPKQFRIAVDSVAGQQRHVFDVFVTPTAPGRLALSSVAGPDVLIEKRGEASPVQVQAVLTSGNATAIRLTADALSLPQGWTVSPAAQTVAMTTPAGGRPTGTATFNVTAPSSAIGTSRAVLRLVGTAASANETSLRATTDIILNLASTFGVEVERQSDADQLNQTIAPGGDVVFRLAVSNLGLGADTVRFTNTALPTGWTVLVNPPTLTLGPLETHNVTVKVTAPVTAGPGAAASFLLFAASVGDPTVLDTVPLRAQVGFHALKIEAVGDEPYGAPQETVARVLNVTNTGTLPDEVQMRSTIDTTGLRRSINQTGSPTLFKLEPGQTQQVLYSIGFAADIPSNATLQATAKAVSTLDARPEAQRANASVPVRFHVLPYQTLDANGDKVAEYAVDRDRDSSNGFEEFRPNAQPGGRPLAAPDLSRFLRDDARAAFERDVTLDNGTTVRVLVYGVDGDGDGKRDHFLDGDGDSQPDYYWDPDANKASPIEFRKDVNGDQVPESFVDTDGDGALDAVFDLTRGTFTRVLQVDVDGDNRLDYVVDKDGDGQVDQDETVLFTRTGGLLIVQKVDVDGDGRLDQVFDTDGDGNPDYFIPGGSKDSVPITMRDVNGDGVMDWTFDGDNDGRKESYYDPATGRSHTIDAAGHFGDALREYWYIGALFAVVLVLFVALVLVTRR